jgi:hypothetical protein
MIAESLTPKPGIREHIRGEPDIEPTAPEGRVWPDSNISPALLLQ